MQLDNGNQYANAALRGHIERVVKLTQDVTVTPAPASGVVKEPEPQQRRMLVGDGKRWEQGFGV